MTLLLRKGWSQSTCNTEMRFYPLVQSLTTTVIELCRAIARNPGTSQQLSHANLMCFCLLIDVSRGMASTDIVNIGVGWEDYMDAKKLFERHILANLVPELLAFFFQLTTPLTSDGSHQTVESYRSSKLHLMCTNMTSINVLEYALDLLEVFLDWEFSYTRCQALIPVESCFMPTDQWYSALFEVSNSAADLSSGHPTSRQPAPGWLQQADGSPAITQETTTTTTLFNLIICLYKEIRKELFVSPDSLPRCSNLFRKIRYALNRVSHFRPTRMRSRFVTAYVAAAELQLQLTRALYSPLFFAVADLLVSSILVSQAAQFTQQQSTAQQSNVRVIALEELQCLAHSLSRIANNADVDVSSLLLSDSYAVVGSVLERCVTSVTNYAPRWCRMSHSFRTMQCVWVARYTQSVQWLVECAAV